VNRARIEIQAVADAVDETAPSPGDDGPRAAAEPGQGAIPRQQVRKLLKTVQARTFLVTTIVLAGGLALLWVTKTVVGIEGDAVFIALLLVPVIVFLAMTGQLESFQFAGASAVFRDKLEEVHGSVKEVGQQEPERAAYLGKLDQVLEKDGREFALIYADVDGLRKVMREIYLRERDGGEQAPTRRREEKIRDEILDKLEFALTDAFYDADLDDAKCDVFRLVEPDVAMIVRCEAPHRAHQIAERAEAMFHEAEGCTATTAVVPATYLHALTPKSVDEEAREALKQKKERRNRR
jgi:hypothetical protein